MDFSYFGEYEVAVFDIEDKIRLLLVSTGYFAVSNRIIHQKIEFIVLTPLLHEL